ncbi:hypothetical protein BOC40_00320 [Burkholderia pseudomallei]|uniref:Uncharacterized protein n=1 Tax=Burkholderia pseudomallei (strain 1710b) TaxID=320372 RepID=Q3JN73_BURP1|nr:hypothetical protein BURPS1710b_3615 [Burkholderia pseudomallei 1710b]ARK49433.1 hypothetical protein BOC35_25140 [Burkholderia pseudomallei]ARK53667.1 hypothetical protein BOC36_11365 [Burkholderia pseudomallei]ARK67077.1 hypothetical protein BOC38_10245 [Burkholderia pseudomallei]ARK76369.1 hypothetical protein BOC39_22860 [Burkholderia pseudomallei]
MRWRRGDASRPPRLPAGAALFPPNCVVRRRGMRRALAAARRLIARHAHAASINCRATPGALPIGDAPGR